MGRVRAAASGARPGACGARRAAVPVYGAAARQAGAARRRAGSVANPFGRVRRVGCVGWAGSAGCAGSAGAAAACAGVAAASRFARGRHRHFFAAKWQQLAFWYGLGRFRRRRALCRPGLLPSASSSAAQNRAERRPLTVPKRQLLPLWAENVAVTPQTGVSGRPRVRPHERRARFARLPMYRAPLRPRAEPGPPGATPAARRARRRACRPRWAWAGGRPCRRRGPSAGRCRRRRR